MWIRERGEIEAPLSLMGSYQLLAHKIRGDIRRRTGLKRGVRE